MSQYIANETILLEKIWTLVHQIPVFDTQTELFDPRFDSTLRRTGIDELLTTSALSEELFRFAPQSPTNPTEPLTKEEFTNLPLRMRSEIIWHRLFLANTPLSEATRGVLTVIGLLKMDPKTRNLGAYRNHFKQATQEYLISEIFEIANIEAVISCYNPLTASVRKSWEKKPTTDTDRYYSALELSELFCNWAEVHPTLTKLGFGVKKGLDKNVYPKVKGFLRYALEQSKSVYTALRIPTGTTFADKKSHFIKLFTKCLIPMLLELKIPLAITFTEEAEVLTLEKLKPNDSLLFNNLEFIKELCTEFPELKLLLTDCNYENQHGLIILAKKFPNIMLLGCSGYLSGETTFSRVNHARLEELGASFIAQHSNAEVYEQLLYKWAHSRWSLAKVLQDKYSALYRTGWRITEEELQREIYNLLAGNAKKFLGLQH